jgi:hypothetical protein
MKVNFDIYFLLLMIKFHFPALQCYSHSPCSTNCPQLAETVKKCEKGNDKCYKAAFPGGVSRGCARDRCDVQVNPTFLTQMKFLFISSSLMPIQLWLMSVVKVIYVTRPLHQK